MGRPSTFTDAIADEICDRLADGETLRSISRDDHMPKWQTVYAWMDRDAEFRDRIARARTLGHDSIAEECVDISDGVSGDPQRDKLRVWTRLQLLAKWSPKKYGDRIAHEHGGVDGNPIETRNVHEVPTDVLRAVVARALARRAAGDDPAEGGDVG